MSVENPPNKTYGIQDKESSIDMEAFRAEIGALVAERQEHQADKVQTNLNMIELVGVNPADLTEADAVMWSKAANFGHRISKEELNLPAYLEDIRLSGANISRTSFLQVIANIIQKKADYL